ncbi:hypothetical protein CYMTET_15302 [Cymbomonas tetramitiformis]|uniref:NAD-dependent epimerase/dehydratase domain-containing protein n=1 Tax=Cymbomonas tetramitiformis TaxID=36881 RepID=A0AAE0GEM8_9CHLO|nr:hypothetical protein CYMTET_15302 [Cymbomonas tetramitiformis]|eukprot:gene16878-20053_t
MSSAHTEIPLFKVFMSPEVPARLEATVTSGQITQGPVVEQFEEQLGEYLGNKHVLTLNAATSGLSLAMHMLKKPLNTWPGMNQGDEVLTCPLTCTATNWPILANEFRPRWVDVDPTTCNMDLNDLARKLSPKTKIILLVHWGGSPVDLDVVQGIQEMCFDKYGFRPWVIEDCAHAWGAEWNNQKLGSHDNICVFSFQAIKHLTTGDGGLISFPNKDLYDRAKLLRWYGIDRSKRNYQGKDFRLENDIKEYGFKYHMNDLSATIGLANLPHIDGLLKIYRANAEFYSQELETLPHVTLMAHPKAGTSSYWIYTIQIENKHEFINFMKQKGIVASQVHARNDTNTVVAAYRDYLPNLDQFEKKVVCIPCGWWVTPAQRQFIVETIREFSSSLVVPRSVPRKTIIVTGGCGFIGHHVVEHFVKNTDRNIVVLDKLNYASIGYERLRDTGCLHHVKVFSTDLVQPLSEGLKYEIGTNIEFIVHMAAETHVDNSIRDPVPFVQNNVDSTLSMLEFARNIEGLKAFFYFSTDEVFGPAPGDTMYKEWDRHRPTNPYSSSKSAAENICLAYENTYAVPLMIINVMNAFGERQHPEKFIPKAIKGVLDGQTLDIHAYPDGKRAGTRFYIHGRNIAAAVLFLLEHGQLKEKYNLTGEREVDNLEMAQFIANTLETPLNYQLVNFHQDRPGHDLRYGLSGDKMDKMGWVCPLNFEESLRKTILWSRDNPRWLDVSKWHQGFSGSSITATAAKAIRNKL